MSNHLKNETSPYLLQHAENPVDWYPWKTEAFEKAKKEDKPILLSIGYSTCHWCHVMAHESFENKEIADILNKYFICIKVDKEERPDIDSIYMSVCQALTGSGGWPTTLFLTPEQKPFFAGTYFPKESSANMVGLKELLMTIHEKWKTDKKVLLASAQNITETLKNHKDGKSFGNQDIINQAINIFKQEFDKKYGGFSAAPKFPTPHNLIFLLEQYKRNKEESLLYMVEKTLNQMYRGGIFDHIGYGFCRYSTDRYYLVPHFEKMLYDNALLIIAYSKAFEITKNDRYKKIAERTAEFILREMTSPDGGFYSAQDADSDGEEGKYYVFTQKEMIVLLGEEEGKAFNSYYDITYEGNFEGKSIPNLLHNKSDSDKFEHLLPKIREFRKSRTSLHTDDKILSSWNSLMISALCKLYYISQNKAYLLAAKKAESFIRERLCQQDTLYVSIRNGKLGEKGFIDDYAFYIKALLSLQNVTLDSSYFERANAFMTKCCNDFFDFKDGGFYLYGKENESLILRPKECYDGAIPSGNSMMAYCLNRIYHLSFDEGIKNVLEKQIAYESMEAEQYPSGYTMFLIALSHHLNPPDKIVIVPDDKENLNEIIFSLPGESIKILESESNQYKLLNGKTTYYICKGHQCLPPTNQIS